MKTDTANVPEIESQIDELTEGKDEPKWVTEARYRGMRNFESAPSKDPIISDPLDFIARREETPADELESLDDLPDDTKKLLDELGISDMEQRALQGLTIQDDTGMIDSSPGQALGLPRLILVNLIEGAMVFIICSILG